MKKRKWSRVLDISRYIESGDICPDDESISLVRRYYTPPNKAYPVLAISIYNGKQYINNVEKSYGIIISQSYKKKSGEWWNEGEQISAVPLELIDELHSCIDEAKTILEFDNVK